MADEEFVEDAKIDGLERGSWFGGVLKGVLVGALISGAGIVALSLTQPLPEHLPGVGTVKVVGAPNRVEVQSTPSSSGEYESADEAGSDQKDERATQDEVSGEKTEQEALTGDEAVSEDDGDTKQPSSADQAEPSDDASTEGSDANTSEKDDASRKTGSVEAALTADAERSQSNDVEGQSADENPSSAAGDQTGASQADEDQPRDESSESFEVATLPAPQTTTTEEQPTAEQTTQVIRVPELTLDGKALEINARPFEAPEDAPLMAVVLTDAVAGVQPEALSLLTMPLTLAVASGAKDGRALADVARAAGHEILAELPMAADEGAEAALMAPGQSEAELAAQTVASLAALDVAVGVTAPDGARLLQDIGGMRAVLGPVAKHGFAWVDPKTGAGSAARSVATAEGAAWTTSDRLVAADATEEQIYQNLESASFQARRQGSTVVFLTAGQPALKALLRWGLERGGQEVWFAPISAVIARRSED